MNIRRYVILILFFLIVSICIIAAVQFRNALAHHNRRLDSIPSQIYNSKHGEIEYLLQGEGPTILVSHGITGGVDQGIGLSEDYLGSEYRLLIVSRFGYLKSSMPDNPSPELQAEVYNELLNRARAQ